MSEDTTMQKEPKDAIFQIVPISGERPYKQSIVAYQRADQQIDGQNVPGVTVVLEPNQLGQYVVPANHPNYKEVVAAVKNKMKRENTNQFKRIIGPFDDVTKALEAMHKERPKTDSESVAIERSKREEVEKENSALRDKIAEMEAKLKKESK